MPSYEEIWFLNKIDNFNKCPDIYKEHTADSQQFTNWDKVKYVGLTSN